MDSDGEDRAEDILKLIKLAEKKVIKLYLLQGLKRRRNSFLHFL